MSQEQLTTIGDVYNLVEASKRGTLSPLQQAAVALADDMTTQVQVRDETFETLRQQLAASSGTDQANKEMTEAVATVAVYNMVSRFLVALDVGDHARIPSPVPGLAVGGNSSSSSSSVSTALAYPTTMFNYSYGLVQVDEGVQLATRVHFHSMQAPWIVLINSLMTNLSMWDWVVPALAQHFNIATYDQRGHGQSTVPPEAPRCTLDVLADDTAAVMDALGVARAHAVVGVSQGGATALTFALRHGAARTARIVACDTQPVSPQANIGAWDERIALARSQGMPALAAATVPRWFVAGQSKASDAVRTLLGHMVSATPVEGFARAARSLQGYDLVSRGLVDALRQPDAGGARLRTLLVAGSADGKLPETLEGFAQQANTDAPSGTDVRFAKIARAGHLPMCDAPDDFVAAVLPFLLEK